MGTHKGFRIASFITLIAIIVTSALYFTIHNDIIKYTLKPIPLFLLLMNIIYYFITYRVHIYSSLLFTGLTFCLIGDILLMFFNPSVPNQNHLLLLIGGGTSFFIARMLFIIMFLIYPYKGVPEKWIEVSILKGGITMILPIIISILIISYLSLIVHSIMLLFLVSLYLIVMNLQLWLSMLRIKGFEEESLTSQILGFAGTMFFNISDILLIINIFSFKINEIIVLSFYWGSMYVLMISVIRSSSFEREKKTILSSELYPY